MDTVSFPVDGMTVAALPEHDSPALRTLVGHLSSHALEGFVVEMKSLYASEGCLQCEARERLRGWTKDGPYATGQRHAALWLACFPHECSSSD